MTNPTQFLVAEGPASDDQIRDLVNEFGCDLPKAYLKFLQLANGVEGGPNDERGDSLRFLPSFEVLKFNIDYGVFEDLPNLICFASDGGDYAFAFDRSSSSISDEWHVVLKPLGTPFAEDLIPVSNTFSTWMNDGFRYCR